LIDGIDKKIFALHQFQHWAPVSREAPFRHLESWVGKSGLFGHDIVEVEFHLKRLRRFETRL
jgi:hypothetical protein